MASSTTSSSSSTHAYAIKSTSSAILSRSNSTNSSLNRHSFSPAYDYQRRRHSKSLNGVQPPTLPTPPSTIRSRKFNSNACVDSDANCSSCSESSSEIGDSTLPSDPILLDLQNGLFVAKPDTWSYIQLSSYLRSRDKNRLADVVASKKITGHEFVNLSHPVSDIVTQHSIMADVGYDDLLTESRNLRALCIATRLNRVSKDSSLQSEESETDSSRTSNRVSRRRVKSMVAALESVPVSSQASVASQYSSRSVEMEESVRNEPIDIKSWVEKSAAIEYGLSVNDSISAVPLITSKSPHQAAEEPSIQALLDSEGVSEGETPYSFGARAWERDVITATAKKLTRPAVTGNERKVDLELPQQLISLFYEGAENSPDSKTQCNLDSTICQQSPESSPHVNNSNDKSCPSEDDKESELVRTLKNRVTELEEMVNKMEARQTMDTSYPTASQQADHDLPQYLLMASIGVCAILGQAVIKKLLWPHN